MVRASLPLAIVLLLPLGMSLSFQVDVAEVTDHSIKNFDYSEEIEHVQEINGTVENVGSIGCAYRFKAVFEQGNDTFERFSAPTGLWQGAYNDLGLYYAPMNYTGLVDTTVYLDYCGQEEEIESFAFNVTEKTLPGGEVESRTKESNSSGATVEVSQGELLIPEEAPSYWKTGSAEVTSEGISNIEYDAPIFTQSNTITYSVVENGEIIGRTEVSLEPEPDLLEALKNRQTELLLTLLGLSVLGNLLILLKGTGLTRKIKSLKQRPTN